LGTHSTPFPTLRAVAGDPLYRQALEALKPWHLSRADYDLQVLRARLKDGPLRKHYVRPLVSDGIGAVAELFAVARASKYVDSLHPHARGPGRKKFDARLTIGTQDLAIEVKHQSDDFPFSSRDDNWEVPGAGILHGGVRPGVDPKFTNTSPPPGATRTVPGAQIWRDTLVEAATQLPKDIPGIVAVSVDAFGGFESDIAAALVGDSMMVGRKWSDGHITRDQERCGNGVLGLDSFRHVAAVWFFKLHPTLLPASDRYETMCVWARGCANPLATGPPLPSAIWLSLPTVWTSDGGES